MGRPLDEDIIIKILERWQKAFKENSHYVSASDLSLVINDVRELPTIQHVATDTNVGNNSEIPNSSDCISRQAAIDVAYSETVSTNPEHFKSSEKFIKFMDDDDIASFGRWQWANGFNTALVASKVQLEKLPSAQPERKKGEWIRNDNGTYSCSVCQSWIPEEQHYYARYCLCCGADLRGKKDG